MKYYIYGYVAESDLEFAQLVPAPEEAEASLSIRKGDIPEDILEKSKEAYFCIDKNRSWISNKTCYIVVTSGRIVYRLKERSGWPEYLGTYILGFGMAMLAFVQNRLAIHCAAVADDKGAVLISGESGSGKSTLTTAFLNAGYHLVADDMACVGPETDEAKNNKAVLAYPGFPYQKLCRDVALREGYELENLIYINEEKDKFLVPCKAGFSTEPTPIKGFILLGKSYKNENDMEKSPDSDIKAEEYKGVEKLPVLINSMFLRTLLGNRRFEAQYVQAALDIVSCIPMACIIRPDGSDTFNDVKNAAFDFVRDWDSQMK